MPEPKRADVYQDVTSRIIEQLEHGVRPWLKPWSADNLGGKVVLPLRFNGEPYRGINVLMLWGAAMAHGYPCPVWMTYRQAQEIGGQVRKGEKSSVVVHAGTFTREQENTKTGETKEVEGRYLKQYSVFNVDQIDGLPPHYYHRPEAPALPVADRIAHADAFAEATRARIDHGGNRAFYAHEPADRIQMPPFEAFRDAESYYATLLHELIHWTKASTRLDRDLGRKKHGDEGYAREELVAEIGAAFLCAALEITPEPREDHAAYLASWLEVLRNDKRAIFTAAAHAQRAADFLHSLQPQEAREAA